MILTLIMMELEAIRGRSIEKENKYMELINRLEIILTIWAFWRRVTYYRKTVIVYLFNDFEIKITIKLGTSF